jgi:hypothetical protein
VPPGGAAVYVQNLIKFCMVFCKLAFLSIPHQPVVLFLRSHNLYKNPGGQNERTQIDNGCSSHRLFQSLFNNINGAVCYFIASVPWAVPMT